MPLPLPRFAWSWPSSSSFLGAGLRLSSGIPHPTGPFPCHEWRSVTERGPSSVCTSQALLRGGAPRPPMESIPLVQSHLQTQGMFSQANGTKTTPVGRWEERPGKAIRVCSACAQTCALPPWLLNKESPVRWLGRAGLGVGPRGQPSLPAEPAISVHLLQRPGQGSHTGLRAQKVSFRTMCLRVFS